jgi:hypothetical protein
MLRRVDWWIITGLSKDRIAFVFRLKLSEKPRIHQGLLEGTTFLRRDIPQESAVKLMRDFRSGVSFIFHLLLGQQVCLSQGFYLRRATLACKTKTEFDIHFPIGGLLTKHVTVTKIWRHSTESLLAYQRRISCHLWVTRSQQVCSLLSLSLSLSLPPPVGELSLRFAPLLSASFRFSRRVQSTVNEYDRSCNSSHIQCFGWWFASDFLQLEVPGSKTLRVSVV